MGDERPVLLKKRKLDKDDIFQCIVHYDRCDSKQDIRPLSAKSFGTIQESARLRQQQVSAAVRLDVICGRIPSLFIESLHGAHRWCYQNFSNVSKLRSVVDGNTNKESARQSDETPQNCSASASRSSARSKGSSSSQILFPPDQCMFCDRGRIRSAYRRPEKLSTCLTETAESSIREAAERKQDFRILGEIEGMDLRAREAKYHESCRVEFIRVVADKDEVVSGRIRAYSDAFQNICCYIEETMIQQGGVERMTMIHERYMQFLKENTPQFYNGNFSTQRLKDKIKQHFKGKLSFWRPNGKSCLVFSSTLQMGEAVEAAFEASTSEIRIIQEAAAILRRDIQVASRNSKTMPWPPSADFLASGQISPPPSLTDFLASLISGKNRSQRISAKTTRLSSSIGEDICAAVTRGRWKMPKHLLLSMTLRALTGRADVLTIINRFGHCQSYSGTMELETALANQVQLQDSVLPSNISSTDSRMVHLCFDNFDINEETPSGSGTTHTTHGIVIQELCPLASTPKLEQAVMPRTKVKTLKVIECVLEPSFSKKRTEPNLSVSTNTIGLIGKSQVPNTSDKQNMWTICRALFNQGKTVPQWTGWISSTSIVGPKSLSNIGYMAPIMAPITDYSTVQHCLVLSQDVSAKVGQKECLVTMDLAAAKIAYDIVWDSGDRFSNVVINLGPFHIMCSYMGSLGKMMTGSGLEEIILEAGICASGSINQVISGKHFNRAIRVHQIMVDALQRLLLDRFVKEADVTIEETAAISELASSPSASRLTSALQNNEFVNFITEFDKFKVQVHNGEYGKTGKMWLQYCECVWVLLRFQQSIKENNFPMFVDSLQELCALLFSADHQNYARYLSYYYVQLLNLSASHPVAHAIMQDCGFSVKRSGVPGCRNAVDLTIEQTINRSAKSQGGIIGFSRNVSAYQRWCLTRHKRAEYVEATLSAVDMADSSSEIHKTNRVAQMAKGEADVARVLKSFDQFQNPFNLGGESKDRLVCLASGISASDAVDKDLLRYVEIGKQAAEEFIKERIVIKSVKFQEPLKRLNLKTFQTMARKCTLTTAKQKTVQIKAERNLLGRLLVLSQSHNISIEKLFKYPLGPIPWALATVDGGLVKTDKSQLMHALERTAEQVTPRPSVDTSTYVIDGNAQFQSMNCLAATFEDLAFSVFNSLPKSPTVHFVTDTYNQDSIKQLERNRRGVSATFTIGGSKTKLPKDFKSFLMNGDNKRQLTDFLLKEWQTERYAPFLNGREIFFVSEKLCWCLSSSDGIIVSGVEESELMSCQEEADTRIILHCLYAARKSAGKTNIIVKSPDTDVFILLTAYSADVGCPLFFDTGHGNKRRLIDINEIAAGIGLDTSAALPSFHAFTGCDTTSAFMRKGKKGPLKVLKQNKQYVEAFKSIRKQQTLTEQDLNFLERFVCAMYGNSTYTDVDRLRSAIFQSRYEPKKAIDNFTIQSNTGIDISLLPPCRSSLHMHALRANYQAYVWKHAHEACILLPSALGCGWKQNEDGSGISVEWTRGNIMPAQLLDVLASEEDKCTEDDRTEEEITVESIEEDEIDNILDVIFDEDDEED